MSEPSRRTTPSLPLTGQLKIGKFYIFQKCTNKYFQISPNDSSVYAHDIKAQNCEKGGNATSIRRHEVEKQRDGKNNIIFPRERTPFAIGGARFERRIYGGHVPAHVTRLRAMNSNLGSPSASRFNCASACSVCTALHTLAFVSLKDASVFGRPRGGFRLIVRPILHPLVLIHRIVKWRWPNLLLYRIMVILRGELWNGERCERTMHRIVRYYYFRCSFETLDGVLCYVRDKKVLLELIKLDREREGKR